MFAQYKTIMFFEYFFMIVCLNEFKDKKKTDTGLSHCMCGTKVTALGSLLQIKF